MFFSSDYFFIFILTLFFSKKNRLVGYSGGAALGDMVDNVLQDDGDDDSDSGGGERRVGLGVFVFVVLREVMRNLF